VVTFGKENHFSTAQVHLYDVPAPTDLDKNDVNSECEGILHEEIFFWETGKYLFFFFDIVSNQTKQGGKNNESIF